jgi:hypothetical protein
MDTSSSKTPFRVATGDDEREVRRALAPLATAMIAVMTLTVKVYQPLGKNTLGKTPVFGVAE